MARVGLVFGGRSVEHEVSITSARTVAEGLRGAGHEVVPLGIAPDGVWLPREIGAAALDGELDHLPVSGEEIRGSFTRLIHAEVEVVFPIVHGTWGEDGCLQGLCEMLDLPYAGTGVTTSAVAMDKAICKQQLAAAGLQVVDCEIVTRGEVDRDSAAVLERLQRLPRPVFVKPCIGGSSVGISKVTDAADLCAAVQEGLRFDDRLVVERGIKGRELEIAVLGYGEIEASVIGEIVPGADFYDYADKYLEDKARLLAPADLPEAETRRLQDLAIRAFEAIGGWGMSRVDFLLESGGRAYINEINTHPGFTSISMYPRLWELSGKPLPALVDRLVDIALARHRDRASLDEGIKSWIAELAARG